MGDGDDTEILVTEGAIQTANTDDLGIQTSIGAISQPVDQGKKVIPVEGNNETTKVQQTIAGKRIGTNDLSTTIAIFLVTLNDHRHYFLKIRLMRDQEGNIEISIPCPIQSSFSFHSVGFVLEINVKSYVEVQVTGEKMARA